jgi:phosphopantothenoylcysteine decarboxylase
MPNILLGLTGSVASVLAPKLIEALGAVGDVAVITTETVSHFIPTYKLWEAVGANPVKTLPNFHYGVFTDREEWLWHDKPEGQGVENRDVWKKNDLIVHIELRKWADVLVVAPLTANTLAKVANGICDNTLTALFRAWDFKKPIVLAPAMNSDMWAHPITEQHLKTIKGWRTILQIAEPVVKKLACGDTGKGAMADISTIVKLTKASLKLEY